MPPAVSPIRRLHAALRPGHAAKTSGKRKGQPMIVIDVRDMTPEPWRLGVETRMLVSASNGAAQLCVFEQWIAPGAGMHGFRNSGTVTLHIHAVLAAPFFEANVEGETETVKRWKST
jgi:hypothetical protein